MTARITRAVGLVLLAGVTTLTPNASRGGDQADAGAPKLIATGWDHPTPAQFRRHVAAIEKETARIILCEKAGAEVCREKPKPLLSPEVDLPEAVARGDEALYEKEIIEIAGADMGNAPRVHRDLGVGLQASNLDGFALHGRSLGAPRAPTSARGACLSATKR